MTKVFICRSNFSYPEMHIWLHLSSSGCDIMLVGRGSGQSASLLGLGLISSLGNTAS